MLTVLISAAVLAGVLLLLYPMAASWLAQYEQARVVREGLGEPKDEDTRQELLAAARAYNDALQFGVLVPANSNVAKSTGKSEDAELNYWELLRVPRTEAMSRVQIPQIDVDLPVYHGTDEQTLLEGGGHLEGSHLPVGGVGTRTVITAHRGLANARMFTDLIKVDVGDDFSLVTAGEVFQYRVIEKQTIRPEKADVLDPDPDRDLATLITCTPLGVNSHRILVTGMRVEPTSSDAIDAGNRGPDIPRFPWWLPLGIAGISLPVTLLVREEYKDARWFKTKNTL